MILYSSSQRYGFQPQELHGLRKQNMRGWRNWQTRTFEVRVVYPWGFKSPPSHQKIHEMSIETAIRGFCFVNKKQKDKSKIKNTWVHKNSSAFNGAGNGNRTDKPRSNDVKHLLLSSCQRFQ